MPLTDDGTSTTGFIGFEFHDRLAFGNLGAG